MNKINDKIKILIFKFINKITIPLFKNGVAGHMRVYIDEALIADSVESCINSLDKLYISYHSKIAQVNEIKNLKKKYGKKIVLIRQKYTPNYYKLYQKSFRKIWWKYYMKIDADQIYINEVLDENIKKIKESKSLTIIRMIGVNIYSSNNKWCTLKKKIQHNTRTLRIENGGYDHFIISRTVFQRYKKYEFDNRIIERFHNTCSSTFKELWGGVNFLHFGPIKLGIRSLNKDKCNVESIGIENFKKYSNNKECEEWLSECIKLIDLSVLEKYQANNMTLIKNLYKKSMSSDECKDHLLYKK